MSEMVIYDFCCSRAHTFEGWFKNHDDYVCQLEQGLIRCPMCDSSEVIRQPVAPAVHIERRTSQLDRAKKVEKCRNVAQQPQVADMEGKPVAVTALRALTDAVKTIIDRHFDDVGEHFTDEAIAIHQGEAEPHNIVGTATTAQEAELDELEIPYNKLRLFHFDD